MSDEEKQPEHETQQKIKRVKNKFDFEKNARTIFVGNLPSNLDQKGIAKLFKDCGPIESARIRSVVPEKETLSPKVALITKQFHPKVNSFNAYVVFKDEKSVAKALALNGQEVEEHRIRVDRASRPKARKETLASRKKSIFVGNLKFDIRDDDLIRFFESKVGPVKYVRIVRDSATGAGKGFGFVVFDERASVKKALEFDESKLNGRPLRIKKVEDEDKKSKNINKSKNKGAVQTKNKVKIDKNEKKKEIVEKQSGKLKGILKKSGVGKDKNSKEKKVNINEKIEKRSKKKKVNAK